MYWDDNKLKSNLKLIFLCLEQLCPVIQIKYAVLHCVLDFFCLYNCLIYFDGCNSPPNPFDFKNLKLNGGSEMEDKAKCFIRIAKGIFEEITYKELKERRKTISEYNDKKFIPIQGMLLEVTDREYKDFYKSVERHKYIANESRRFRFISTNEMAKDDEDNEIRGADILPDENVDIDFEVARKIEVEQLKEALLKLNDDEYKLIRALFFEEKTLREYAEIVGKHYTTIYTSRNKILEKLKKFLKI